MTGIDAPPREEVSRQVNEYWSRDQEQLEQTQGWYWMRHPMVVARVNMLISGDPSCDAYSRLKRLYLERGWDLPIRRSASLGCGFGNLERKLKAIGLVDQIDAYDIAEGAIEQARRLAAEAGLTGLRYHVADLERLELPANSLDAVFAHSAVHHVEDLERLYAVVRRALRPGGVFHLHEFVGPTRFQWTDAQLRLINEFMDSLPGRLRRVPSGAPKGRLERPTVEQMIAVDPSEAIRSSELVSALHPFFETIEERRTGGAILHLGLADIAQNFDPESPEDRAILQRGFALEDEAMASGEIGSDFAIITAVPQPVREEKRPKSRSVTGRAKRFFKSALRSIGAGRKR